MPKIYDAIEIGLTRAELRQALRCWVQYKAMISDYTITDFSLHPTAEYVIRFKVEPPLAKVDQEKLTQQPKCETRQIGEKSTVG